MTMTPQFVRFLIMLFVALGSLTYGYCSSIIATTLGQPSFNAYFQLTSRSNASGLIGAINGLFQAGGLFGALSCMQIADSFGRRKALFVASIITIIGGALQAGSLNIGMYMAMRFITGLGVGALVTLVPLYQSEIAPPKIRGLLVGTHGILICTGYALASWVGVGFYFVNASGAQWRIPLAIQCIPPLLLAIGILSLPETPRWLMAKDQHDVAYKAFSMSRAESSEDSQDRLEEFEELRRNIDFEKLTTISFMDFFRKPSLRKRVIIGWLTMFGAQGTATIVINNYGPSLYAGLGFGTVQQLVIQGAWVSVCPFGNWINALVVDRVGRTPLLLFEFGGCVVALVGECITVSVFQRAGSHAAASAAVFFLFLHIACFSSSVDATSYIYCSEIFPTPARAKGLPFYMSHRSLVTTKIKR